MMALSPGEVSLGRVVRLLEDGQALVECFGKGENHCSIDGACRLKVRLRFAENAFLAALDKSTLADVALLSTHNRPL